MVVKDRLWKRHQLIQERSRQVFSLEREVLCSKQALEAADSSRRDMEPQRAKHVWRTDRTSIVCRRCHMIRNLNEDPKTLDGISPLQKAWIVPKVLKVLKKMNQTQII